jgi:hypothetical protein
MWELECPRCEAQFEITTGAGITRGTEPAMFGWTQRVCRSCGRLYSVAAPEGESTDMCPGCGRPSEPWGGIAGFPEGSRIEVVEGSCPRCEGPLVAEARGLWD